MNEDIFSFSGIVYRIKERERKTARFEKQDIVLIKTTTYSGKKYRNYITFTAINKMIGKLDSVKEGDYVDIFFVLSGNRLDRENGEELFFNSLKLINLINRGRAYVLDPGTENADEEEDGEGGGKNKEFQNPLAEKKKETKEESTQSDLPLDESDDGGDDDLPF